MESKMEKMEREILNSLLEERDRKLKSGIRAHTKRIPLEEGMKDTVVMTILAETGSILSLVSTPFDTYEDAKRFSECMDDNFLIDTEVEEKDGQYFVYTGWVIKHGFNAYAVCKPSKYYEFANWS